ncbi:hypothetical protein [Legionella parisiensis]|nr:hypothetical protein [Legionella parisiensis]KTD41831.1 hypothetical protein Lpar_3148 [Legionella parisiensis]STX75842.1 Uncharacterised protein [Legionella parisiensis]
MKHKLDVSSELKQPVKKKSVLQESSLSSFIIFARTDKRERITLNDLIGRVSYSVTPGQHLNISTASDASKTFYQNSGYLSTFEIKDAGSGIDAVLDYADTDDFYLHFIFLPKSMCEEIHLSGGTQVGLGLEKKDGTVWQIPHYNTMNPQVFYTTGVDIELGSRKRTHREALLGGQGLEYAQFVSIKRRDLKSDDFIKNLTRLFNSSSYHYYDPETIERDRASAIQQRVLWGIWSKDVRIENEEYDGYIDLLKFTLNITTEITSDSPHLKSLCDLHNKITHSEKNSKLLDYLSIARSMDNMLIRACKAINSEKANEQVDTLRTRLQEALKLVLENKIELTTNLITAFTKYKDYFSREINAYQYKGRKEVLLKLLTYLEVDFTNPTSFYQDTQQIRQSLFFYPQIATTKQIDMLHSSQRAIQQPETIILAP